MNIELIIEIARLHGYLPLAVQIAAKQLSFSHYSPKDFIKFIKQSEKFLHKLTYESTSLLRSLDLSYKKLNHDEQALLTSLVLFSETDFSINVVAYILDLDITKAKEIVSKLAQFSLLEQASHDRYRLHPVICTYLQSKFSNKKLYLKAAEYYISFIKDQDKINNYDVIEKEVESVIEILNVLIASHKHNLVCSLFEQFGMFIWTTGKWSFLKKYIPYVLSSMKKANNHRATLHILATTISWYFYWSGDISRSRRYLEKALDLALHTQDSYYIFFIKERLGRIYQGLKKLQQSEIFLQEAHQYFSKVGDIERIVSINRYSAEGHLLKNDIEKADTLIKTSLPYLKSTFTWSSLQYKEITRALIIGDLGLIYYLKNHHLKAKKLFLKSLSLQVNANNMTVFRVWTNCIIGLICETTNKQAEAKQYFKTAVDSLILVGEIKNLCHTSIQFHILKKKLEKSPLFNQHPALRELLK